MSSNRLHQHLTPYYQSSYKVPSIFSWSLTFYVNSRKSLVVSTLHLLSVWVNLSFKFTIVRSPDLFQLFIYFQSWNGQVIQARGTFYLHKPMYHFSSDSVEFLFSVKDARTSIFHHRGPIQCLPYIIFWWKEKWKEFNSINYYECGYFFKLTSIQMTRT